VMDDTSHTGIHYRSDDFNEAKPNRYTIIRAQFDKWFSRKVREMPKPETVAIAVKEMHFLPEEVIGQRFGVKGDEGCVIEAVG
ncbi:FAD-dependent oxidoreductase, partial [Mesorhizobium sp. M7A.F.Ca.CA.002.12.1.1]